jgi:hypothetical protein
MNAPALWTAFFGSGSGISHLFGLATDTGAWSERKPAPARHRRQVETRPSADAVKVRRYGTLSDHTWTGAAMALWLGLSDK